MKKIFALSMILLSGCVNTGNIISGELVVNSTKINLSGKEIILNEDCSPQYVNIDIPYCGNGDIKKGEICTTTPDQQQYGYKIFQVINNKDALICTINGYGNCYGNIEYVKNLGANFNDDLVDDVRIEGSTLIKTKPYSYETLLGIKTIVGYEAITKAEYNKIKYRVDNTKKCEKLEYSYSKKSKEDWIVD